MLITIIEVVRVVGTIFVLVGFGSHQTTEAIFALLIALVILALLWNRRASEFFDSSF